MTVTISNRSKVSAVFHVTGSSNATIVVTGNSSVSNVAAPGETVTGGYLAQAVWGVAPGGYIVIKRGTEIVGVYDSTGIHEYAGAGMPIKAGLNEANMTVEFVGTANGFITFELHKVLENPNANSDYFRT